MEETHFLTLSEVANLLRVNRATIYRMARSGAIPASKIGHQWRFERSRVTQWLRQQEGGARVLRAGQVVTV